MIAGLDYLDPLLDELAAQWPNNRTVSIVCHGTVYPRDILPRRLSIHLRPIPICCTASSKNGFRLQW